LLALVPATLGHLSVSWALRHVDAHGASTALLAVPLFASLWAHLFVGERVTAAQIVAGAVVLLAIPGAIRPSGPELRAVAIDPGGEIPVEDGEDPTRRGRRCG
ncbi:MAG: EamA family transporter, partial [Candidatus Binatia bacterium]